MQHNRIFIFIGPEGAGKSTQANLLATKTGLPYVSTGNLIRSFAENDRGELGNAARKMFASHSYLAAKFLKQIFIKTLNGKQYQRGVILDGSLRTYEETIQFDDLLKESRLTLPVVVLYIYISEEESIKRLVSKRRRRDDTIEGIKSRLAYFNDKLVERLQVIQSKYQLLTVDGMKPIAEVHKDVKNSINIK